MSSEFAKTLLFMISTYFKTFDDFLISCKKDRKDFHFQIDAKIVP